MSNLPLPEEPKFVKTVTATQKILASISGSMFFVVYITGFDFIQNIFKPDYVFLIGGFRMVIALIALGLFSFVGYHQIGNMGRWLIDNYETYKKLSDFKKQQDQEK